MKCCVIAVLILGAVAKPPHYGKYKPARKFYKVPKINGDGGEMHVYYPSDASQGEKFPLISYAHGVLGGGIDLFGYTHLFNQLASFGFIVVAPDSCNDGCKDQEKHPWADCNPDSKWAVIPGFRTWFGEQLRAIEWAQNQTKAGDSIFEMLDMNSGVGVAGHSMGGQATAYSAHENCTSKWNIKAAAVHHGVTAVTNHNIGVPLAGFGGVLDEWISDMTKEMFEQSPVYPKLWRDIRGLSSTHLEPLLEAPLLNPLLGTYTAAWLKIHLRQDPDKYWHGLIFDESNADYLCNSQSMQECIVKSKAPEMSTVIV